jgi:hypothetical protein
MSKKLIVNKPSPNPLFFNNGLLGQLIHPFQDFWAHSNAIYVSGCAVQVCISFAFSKGKLVCSRWACGVYSRRYFWLTFRADLPSEQEAKNAGLKTGTYGSGIWGALIDKSVLV